MPTSPDIHALVESFTNDLSVLMRRAALEEVHAKLSLVIGDVQPRRRAPARPRATAVAAVPQRKKKGGKRTAADLCNTLDTVFSDMADLSPEEQAVVAHAPAPAMVVVSAAASGTKVLSRSRYSRPRTCNSSSVA